MLQGAEGEGNAHFSVPVAFYIAVDQLPPMDLPALKLDSHGLIVAIVQDRFSGELRMSAFANEEAVRLTLETGFAHFFSRSRGRLWKKGEESGNVLHVHEVHLDCDRDAVLYLADPVGPTCHTGTPSCFIEPLRGLDGRPLLPRLEAELVSRRDVPAGRSYTRSLLDGGAEKIGEKVREEADELAVALADESDARVVSESADVLYHLMVGLTLRGLSLRDVSAELARRFGTSGHDEKASRTK